MARSRARLVLYVLADVNGAGKSSIGGHLLERAGLIWFNPDNFARELAAETGLDQIAASEHAWHEGIRRLDEAIAQHHHHAFEAMLGGNSVAARIQEAARSHDVLVWFCGLSSPELHLARVAAREAAADTTSPRRASANASRAPWPT